MKIKELKEMIENLPDDMLVVNCHDGELSMCTDKNPKITKGKVYLYEFKDYYNRNKIVEYSNYLGDGRIHEIYEALIIHTQA